MDSLDFVVRPYMEGFRCQRHLRNREQALIEEPANKAGAAMISFGLRRKMNRKFLLLNRRGGSRRRVAGHIVDSGRKKQDQTRQKRDA